MRKIYSTYVNGEYAMTKELIMIRSRLKRVAVSAAIVGGLAASSLAFAAPATAVELLPGTGCPVTSTTPIAGGYQVTTLCNVNGVGTVGLTAYGNTVADAKSNASYLARWGSANNYCTGSIAAPIPGGYQVVYTCWAGGTKFAVGAGADLNTATAWANFQAANLR